MYPAKWFFRKHEEEPTTEVAIRRGVSEDLYIVMPAFDLKDQTASLHVVINPLVNWIWVGFGVMALGTGIALLPIPAGTRNHFARDLGIPTLDDAVAAAQHGRTVKIDLGRVNDTVFVNNSSIGLYPRMVMTRDRDYHPLPKLLQNVIAGYKQLRAGRRITVDVGGRPHRAWLVFVGNARYGLWSRLSVLNKRHALYAWLSLFSVLIADVYIRFFAAAVEGLRVVR